MREPRPPNVNTTLPYERRENDANFIFLSGRLDGHEQVCAERYANIADRLLENKNDVSRLFRMAWVVAGSIIMTLITGFGALWAQLHSSPALKHLVD